MPIRTLGAWIEANAWAILGTGSMALTGYAVGQSNMTNRLDQLTEAVATLRADMAKVQGSNRCLIRHVDLLESGAKTPPTCEME